MPWPLLLGPELHSRAPVQLLSPEACGTLSTTGGGEHELHQPPRRKVAASGFLPASVSLHSLFLARSPPGLACLPPAALGVSPASLQLWPSRASCSQQVTALPTAFSCSWPPSGPPPGCAALSLQRSLLTAGSNVGSPSCFLVCITTVTWARGHCLWAPAWVLLPAQLLAVWPWASNWISLPLVRITWAKAAVPNLLGTGDWFCGSPFFHGLGEGNVVQAVTRAMESSR